MAMGGFVGIGVNPAGDGFAQVVLAAVFANFSGNITNYHHSVFALQSNGGDSGLGMAGLADGALHHALLCLSLCRPRGHEHVIRPIAK